MTREIKFRAWHKRDKEMVPVQGIMYNEDDEAHEVQHPDFPVGYCVIGGSIENYELMQYTGLKDKNGVEIYEGDIVSWKYMEAAQAPVEYDSASVAYRPFCQLQLERVRESFEVIGNIHENPELLEEAA